jgi:hypothetical protein
MLFVLSRAMLIHIYIAIFDLGVKAVVFWPFTFLFNLKICACVLLVSKQMNNLTSMLSGKKSVVACSSFFAAE